MAFPKRSHGEGVGQHCQLHSWDVRGEAAHADDPTRVQAPSPYRYPTCEASKADRYLPREGLGNGALGWGYGRVSCRRQVPITRVMKFQVVLRNVIESLHRRKAATHDGAA